MTATPSHDQPNVPGRANVPGRGATDPPPLRLTPEEILVAEPATDRNFIRTCCLTVAYHGKPAVADVEACFARHRITAVIGPSGCGKSTFLSSLNRMIEHVPGSSLTGSIRVGPDVVTDRCCDDMMLRRRIGTIFQRPTPFPMSIRRNLDMPLREHGVRSRAEREQIIELSLREVGLWDEVGGNLRHRATRLSGGQQQRLCIARALALAPEVLLMDEPCSALDPLASGVIEDLLARLRQRLTVVIVTHNLGQARRLADDVAVFWHRDGAGRLIEFGPVEDVFRQPQASETRAYISGQRG